MSNTTLLGKLIDDGKIELITITKKEYDQLIHSQKFLNALQGAGVDNWEGYNKALSETCGV